MEDKTATHMLPKRVDFIGPSGRDHPFITLHQKTPSVVRFPKRSEARSEIGDLSAALEDEEMGDHEAKGESGESAWREFLGVKILKCFRMF